MSSYYLGKVPDFTSDEKKANIMVQIGNAFYLREAYDVASHIYEEILKTNPDVIEYDKI
jgi:hypothetical protein